MWDRDYNLEAVPFETLTGKTISEIVGLEIGSERVTIICDDGYKIQMSYYADCCASCSVEDICGNAKDLIGKPLVMAEEVVSSKNPPGVKKEYQNSFTWSFYKLATNKGSVTIRWYGESNGYYSESVTVEKMS
jgi:hypothetical protein